MAQKFLSPEDLAKKMKTFKDKWYSISLKSEKLSNFASGTNAGFKKAIPGILSDLEKSKKRLQELEKQLKHTFPTLRKDIDSIGKKINNSIDDFTDDVKRDMRDIETLVDLQKKLDLLNKDLKKADEKYSAFEKKNSDIGTKYFDMKSDYAHKQQQIENESNDAEEKLKKKFYDKAEPIIKDHNIYVGPKKVDLDTLFNMILESRSTVTNIKLISKKGGGLFGRSKEDNKARSSVLKYVGGEILEGTAPIKKKEKRLLTKLESSFSELKNLERKCQKNEMKLKDLARPRDEISAQIARIKEDKALRLSHQDGVLEVRENYLKYFNEAHEHVKEYLEVTGKALEGYEPPELDVEKRELRAKNKELNGTVKVLEEKLSSTKKELSSKTKEFETNKESLDKEIQNLEELKADLDTKLSKTTSKLNEAEESRDDYKTQTENLTVTKKTLEKDIKGLEKTKSSLEKQLEDTTAKLTTSEGQREEYKQRSQDLSQGLDALKKDISEELKEFDSNMKTKIDDIKTPKK